MTIASNKPGSGKERLERALIRLSRGQRTGRSRAQGRQTAGPDPASSADRVAAPIVADRAGQEPPAGIALPAELIELVDRLDIIADRLADLEHTGRPLPATRDIFVEWVRTRKWEEIPFREFLALRRAGRL